MRINVNYLNLRQQQKNKKNTKRVNDENIFVKKHLIKIESLKYKYIKLYILNQKSIQFLKQYNTQNLYLNEKSKSKKEKPKEKLILTIKTYKKKTKIIKKKSLYTF